MVNICTTELPKTCDNFRDYLNLHLNSKITELRSKLYVICQPCLMEFILHSYNHDVLRLLDYLKSDPKYDIQANYVELLEVHELFLTKLLDKNPSPNQNRIRKTNTSDEEINFLKELPFEFLSPLLIDFCNTQSFKHFGLSTRPESSNISMHSPEGYLAKLLKKRYPILSLQERNSRKNTDTLIKELTRKLLHVNPDMKLIACGGIIPLFVQICLSVETPDELYAYISERKSNDIDITYFEYFKLFRIWVETLIKSDKNLLPLLDIHKHNHVKLEDLPLNYIPYFKCKNNLNYTNSQIFELLTRDYSLHKLLNYEIHLTGDTLLHPETTIQTLLYEVCLSYIPTYCEITDFYTSVVLKGNKPVEKAVGSNVGEYSGKLFTPSQLNKFLLENANIQNKLIKIMSKLSSEKTQDNLKEFANTLLLFYKAIYTYYCRLNNLNPNITYKFKNEIDSYNNRKLTERFEGLFQEIKFARKIILSHPQAFDDKYLNVNYLLQSYVDIQYPMDFLNDLLGSTNAYSNLVDIYKVYLTELIKPVFEKLIENVSDLKDIKLPTLLIEGIITKIPHHFVRNMMMISFNSTTTTKIDIDSIVNSLNCTISSLYLLESLSYLAINN